MRHDTLTVARALYKVAALNYHERLIMLCDRARVLARNDRPETMPVTGNKIAAPAILEGLAQPLFQAARLFGNPPEPMAVHSRIREIG